MVSNSTIKLVQSLKHKKYRQKYNLFVVEGWKSISTVLNQADIIVERIYALKTIKGGNYCQSPDVILATSSEIGKLSHLQSPTDAIALIRLDSGHARDAGLGRKMIYLDDIQDPGNLGTIIRIADWYGFTSIIRSTGSADFYGPKVVQSTMGSFVNLKLLTMEQQELVKRGDVQIVVTALDSSNSLRGLSIDKPICLVIGNEGKGVSQFLLERATITYTIGGAASRVAESLNAAIATGIMCDKIHAFTTIE